MLKMIIWVEMLLTILDREIQVEASENIHGCWECEEIWRQIHGIIVITLWPKYKNKVIQPISLIQKILIVVHKWNPESSMTKKMYQILCECFSAGAIYKLCLSALCCVNSSQDDIAVGSPLALPLKYYPLFSKYMTNCKCWQMEGSRNKFWQHWQCFYRY